MHLTTPVNISFTRTDLTNAVAHATRKARTKRQHDRIASACRWLNTFDGSAWTLKSATVTIKSATSDATYTLTLGEDFVEHQCKSHVPCWHLTLGSLILAANQLRDDREAAAHEFWSSDLVCSGGLNCHWCIATQAQL